MQLVGKGLHFVGCFLRYVGPGLQLTTLCFFGVLISGEICNFIECLHYGEMFSVVYDVYFTHAIFSISFCDLLFRDGQCPEYSGEEQAICAVGLAKSKPGAFVEAIQYLLVLATPVEVVTPQYLLFYF